MKIHQVRYFVANFCLKSQFWTKNTIYVVFWVKAKVGNFRFFWSRDQGDGPIDFKFSVNLFYIQTQLLCKFGPQRGLGTPSKKFIKFLGRKNKILEFEEEKVIFRKVLQFIMLAYALNYLNMRFEVICRWFRGVLGFLKMKSKKSGF